MKRLDILIAIALVRLVAFVGIEVFATRVARDAEPFLELSTAHALTTEVSNGISNGISSAMSSPTSSVVSSTPIVAPIIAPNVAPIAASNVLPDPRRARDRDAERAVLLRRLADRTPATFIGEILVGNEWALSRWPSRRLRPLRIWIQPRPNLEDESPDGSAIVREAFTDWETTGIPLTFAFALDSVDADVHVTWTDRFSSPISGKTLWSHDKRGWIVAASIILAVHQRTGARLDSSATRAIALHEVGHLIGLDHTADTTSIMTPLVRVRNLSPADRATAQLLYLLPPGRFGDVTQRDR